MVGMHERIELYPPNASPRDEMGHRGAAQAAVGSFWARIEQIGSSESERAGGAVLVRTYQITMRSSTAAFLGLTERHELVWRKRRMAIDAPLQENPRGDYLELTATEVA